MTSSTEPLVLRPLEVLWGTMAQQKKIREQGWHSAVDNMSMVEQTSIKPNMLKTYQLMLIVFCRVMSINPFEMSAERLDIKMVEYFDRMAAEGCGPDAGERLWASLPFFNPRYASHGHLSLPRARRVLKRLW